METSLMEDVTEPTGEGDKHAHVVDEETHIVDRETGTVDTGVVIPVFPTPDEGGGRTGDLASGDPFERVPRDTIVF